MVGPLNHRPGGDVEEFVEQTFRLDAVIQAFGPDRCVFSSKAGASDFVWGPIRSWGSTHGVEWERADAYWNIPAFRRYAGRKWLLAGLAPDDGLDVVQAIMQLHGQGVRNFVVKGTDAKSMLERFKMGDEFMAGEIPRDVYFGAMHREGQQEVYLVQEAIGMVDEYRLFMVGSEPVTGAGCIEHFTPLDNAGDVFDPRVGGIRGTDSVRTDRERVAELVAFGRQVGAEMYAEVPELGVCWVMDVSYCPETGKPVVIELNGARNSGLYASRPELWLTGVREFLATAAHSMPHTWEDIPKPTMEDSPCQ